eukprot:scaffold53495_cov54-Phaeocystis_antarctica.AAC.1
MDEERSVHAPCTTRDRAQPLRCPARRARRRARKDRACGVSVPSACWLEGEATLRSGLEQGGWLEGG